jgi:hypothetical protein
MAKECISCVELACRDYVCNRWEIPIQHNNIYAEMARTLESSKLQSEVNSRKPPMFGDRFAEKLYFIGEKTTDVTTYQEKKYIKKALKKML